MTQKERRDYLVSRHRCVICAERDKRTESGYTYCRACALKINEQNHKTYSKRRAEGLCVKCGQKAESGCFCKECREKAREQQKKQRLKHKSHKSNLREV